MKTVLIALDYSPSAQKVAEAGYSLAKDMGAKTVLLHVIVDPVYYSVANYSPIMGFDGYLSTELLQPDISDDLKKSTEDFLAKSKQHLGDETLQTLTAEGDIPNSILEVAKKVKADVIVMGSHSQKWLESIVMGSVSEQVLHHTSTPLYIIPTKRRD
jgi:nucleotide-binding universal stress UspA family protein